MSAPDQAWADAATAAALFAVDPAGSGVALRARAGPVRERWLASMRALLPSTPMRVVPLHVADERLLGGLDLAATLRAGRPVAQRGLLAEADGGIVMLSMAERASAGTAARIGAVLDAGAVTTTRDGITLHDETRFGVIALDEGIDDEHPPVALLDRLAFHLWLDEVRPNGALALHDAADVAAAREGLAKVQVGGDMIEAICSATVAFGIASARAPLLALRAARASAALDGRAAVTGDDVTLAARLVLAPRATMLPALEQEPESADEARSPPSGEDASREDDADASSQRPLDDIVLMAVKSALPAGLLSELRLAQGGRPRSRSSGKAGAVQKSVRHGRPAGVRRGELRAGARLNVIETLRAAAPWQAIRRREAGAASHVQVRREDFRIARFKQRAETTTIFVVDASGSAALHRLAEAKGAVELLLADCYVRRDQVALLAFRGKGAELLLPPTRSLVRAKRSLAGLPGGGGTPLAAAIDAAFALADSIERKGQTPIVILLTDGRANVARDGSAGRERATEDALISARMLRAANLTSLLVDTSPQPQAAGARIAAEMGAQYLPLPHADAAKLSQAVLAAMN